MTREEINAIRYLTIGLAKEAFKQDWENFGKEDDDYIKEKLVLDGYCEGVEDVLKILENIKQEPKWIPIKTRKLTHAEEQDMLENSNCYYTYMFNCRLPENGEEVLVTTSTGEVTTTTFYDEGLDGCYFEFYEDDGDVIAWMPKPKSYKAESEDEE